MAFWTWIKKFRNQPSQSPRHTPKGKPSNLTRSFTRVRQDMQSVQVEIKQLQTYFNRLYEQVDRHERQLGDFHAKVDSLEARLMATPSPEALPAAKEIPLLSAINRPIPSGRRPITTTRPADETHPAIDLDCLTPQEKRILECFTAHRNMRLSYQDMAQALHKSPHTIKNQIRQLRMKMDCFESSMDEHNLKRFRLKPQLQLKKDLTY